MYSPPSSDRMHFKDFLIWLQAGQKLFEGFQTILSMGELGENGPWLGEGHDTSRSSLLVARSEIFELSNGGRQHDKQYCKCFWEAMKGSGCFFSE